MKPPFPSLTAEWHNDTYSAIDHHRPELSAKGKTVIITGGGSGIGIEVARSWAKAGASHVVLMGRTKSTLEKAASELSSTTKVSTYVAAVEDEAAVKKAAASIGTWDVVILCAGYLADIKPIVESDLEDWFQCYLTNVKGTVVMVKSFMPTATTTRPTIISFNAGSVCLPPGVMENQSAYETSKLATVAVVEHLAVELPHVFFGIMHPGVVETAMSTKTGKADPASGTPIDSARLPADFSVWLASPEAAFLRAKFVWCNWDVEELKAKAERITSDSLLTATIAGWPFSPEI